MYIIMGHTIELMASMDEGYVKELVDIATQNENIFWEMGNLPHHTLK